ncbi:PREDICTED: histone chaperone ASF1-like [Priapulus caudatus]|uniref:Histone chaperone ASF1-like n=1 Tax=Priapulus caudatus TaxID=37621 RepID=A0ABM1DU63_PRICU|nr:PREDICTED: histone chaperone ASF1-like [Priapulus caudatus]
MEKILAAICVIAVLGLSYGLPYDYRVDSQPPVKLLDYLREIGASNNDDYDRDEDWWYQAPYEEAKLAEDSDYYYPIKQEIGDYYDAEPVEDNFEDFLIELENMLNMKNGPRYSTVDADREAEYDEEEEKEEEEKEEEGEERDQTMMDETVQDTTADNTQSVAAAASDDLSNELSSVGQTSAPSEPLADNTETQQTPQEIRDEMDRKRGQPETVSVDGKIGVDVSEVQYDKKEENQLEELKGNLYNSQKIAKKAAHPRPFPRDH